MDKPIKDDKLFELMSKYLNLQWIYEEQLIDKPHTEISANESTSEEAILPKLSAKQAATFLELTMAGDIAAMMYLQQQH